MLKSTYKLLVAGAITVLALSGCSTAQFNKVLGTLCVESSKTAVKLYAAASTPTARKVAENAINATMKAASSVASMVSDGKPGVAKDINDSIASLKKNDFSGKVASGSNAVLLREKDNVSKQLLNLGLLCKKAIETVNK